MDRCWCDEKQSTKTSVSRSVTLVHKHSTSLLQGAFHHLHLKCKSVWQVRAHRTVQTQRKADKTMKRESGLKWQKSYEESHLPWTRDKKYHKMVKHSFYLKLHVFGSKWSSWFLLSVITVQVKLYEARREVTSKYLKKLDNSANIIFMGSSKEQDRTANNRETSPASSTSFYTVCWYFTVDMLVVNRA